VTEVADASPPNIIHTPITNALKGAKIRIKSEVSDFSHSVSTVVVYYRISGGSSYSVRESVLSSGNTYFCDIPENFVTLSGVDYYIKAIDACGNYTISPSNPETNPYHITVSSFLIVSIDSTSDNNIEFNDGTIISIPSGALEKNSSLVIEVPDEIPPLQKGLDKNLTTRKIYLSDGTTTFAKNILVTLAYSEADVPDEEYEQKLRIYRWNEQIRRWEYLGGVVNTNSNIVTLETNHFSTLAVISDIQPPSLSEIYPKKYASQKPKISALVSDDGSGIDLESIIISLDEKDYTYTSGKVSYSEGEIEFIPEKELSYGDHSFVISVKDKAGNLTTTGKLYFQIAKESTFGDAFVYPHPVSPGRSVKIKYELSAQLSNVKIRIYSLTGELIKELMGSGNVGMNEVPWDGKDSYDQEIKSGVYLCYIFGTDPDGKVVEKRFKIAVWKTK
jgi:flagellar hook assembly protein FlgD